MAVQLAVATGVYLASSLLASKPKLERVDRGKLDDIRFTTMEEGAFKPLVYGRRVRTGGVLRWGSETQESVTGTPGRSGGKGGGGQAEPPTNDFTYRKSFAILFAGNRIRRFRRLWEDAEIILNLAGYEGLGYYEAESDLNTLTNATLADASQFSGGRGVQLGVSTGAVEFANVEGYGTATELGFAYVASGTRTCQVWVDGVLAATVSLPSNSGAYSWYSTATVDIPAGAGHTVKLVNTTAGGGAVLYVDILRVEGSALPQPAISVTGVVDESGGGADANDPGDKYNAQPAEDADGTSTGVLTGGGQAAFELYTGTETQLQSPTIVAAEGAENTSAWRGDSYLVFDDYLLKGPQLGNMTAELEPWIQDLAEIMEDLFVQDGRAEASELDFSLLAGTVPEGFIVHTREQLSTWVEQLQLWYNFDVVPVGDKIVAVPRGGAPSFTITEGEISARREGEEPPRGPVRQTHEDPADVPDTVDVLYLDPGSDKEFHTAGQQAQSQAGDVSYDHDTLTFAIVGDAATATAVGRRYLDLKALEAKPFEFATGPAFRHLTPGDVGTLVLEDATHTVRLTGVQAELQGLVKFKAVPERASLYTQTARGQLALGREVPAVEYPANTELVVADCVALRQEDLNKLVVYGAGCGRGRGAWPGYALNREDLLGEVERLGASQKPATIGVVETASQGSADGGHEPTRSFVVKLFAGALESRTLEDVRGERVNLAIYGKGSRWEVLQFLSVTAQTPTFPYVAEYLVEGTVSGIFGTEPFADAHEDDDRFVLVDEGLQSFELRPVDCGQPLVFVGQTNGQAYGDAETNSSVALTFSGVSRWPLAVARVETDPGTGLAPRDSAGTIVAQVWPRSGVEFIGDEYLIEFLSDDRATVMHEKSFREGVLGPALLAGVAGSKFPSGVSRNTLSRVATVDMQARSVQKIHAGGHFRNRAEATLKVTGSGNNQVSFGLAAEARFAGAVGNADVDYLFTLSALTGTLKAFAGGVEIFSETSTSYAAAGKRVWLELVDGIVYFYVDRGDATPYAAVSELPAGFPLVAYARLENFGGIGDLAQVADVMMTTNPLPTTTLTADEQTRYYGGLKSSGVQVTIRQHSGLREVGYGIRYEGVI